MLQIFLPLAECFVMLCRPTFYSFTAVVMVVFLLVFCLQQLNRGARHIKILIDGDVAFDGDLDKGCGNHVFDYGKIIYLGGKSDFGSESPRSDLATTSNRNSKIDPSNSDWLCLHDLDKAIIQDKMSAGSQVGETDITKKSQKVSGYCCSSINIMD